MTTNETAAATCIIALEAENARLRSQLEAATEQAAALKKKNKRLRKRLTKAKEAAGAGAEVGCRYLQRIQELEAKLAATVPATETPRRT